MLARPFIVVSTGRNGQGRVSRGIGAAPPSLAPGPGLIRAGGW